MTKEERLKVRPLYKEVIDNTGREIGADEQSDPYLMLRVIRTKCVQATEEEIKEAQQYLKEHGKCGRHLIFDENTFMYYSRYCGICGKFIDFI